MNSVICLDNRSKTQRLVKEAKAANADFEFYPTTSEMLTCITSDIRDIYYIRDEDKITLSCLDVGAGDGRALVAITQGERYAIEKSQTLLNALPKDVFVVGTDFNQQTLIDKATNLVFSNPPYSEYVAWTVKVLSEAAAATVYMVIPARFKDNQEIQTAVETRRASYTVLGEFDFLEADRQARAKVAVVRFDLGNASRYRHSTPKVDPFELWFENTFKLEAQKTDKSDHQIEKAAMKSVKARLEKSHELVVNDGLVNVLERLYQKDMNNLMKNYLAVCELSPELLNELNVNMDGLKSALKLKLKSTKRCYWHELFEHLSTITDRLTTASRENLLKTLQENTQIDFSASNAHSVVLWAIKNANSYFDSQFIDLFEDMLSKTNIVNYKSNQRTFGREEWRYLRDVPRGLSHYGLDLRVIVESVGGLSSDYSAVNGLSTRAANFLNDLVTVAYNLGFDVMDKERARDFDWKERGKKTFTFFNHDSGQDETLFEATAFQKGTVHIKFNQAFICKMNVEMGRLKGWLRSASEAAEELNIDSELAADAFNCNHVFLGHTMQALGFNKAA